jgi:hypothetical protein
MKKIFRIAILMLFISMPVFGQDSEVGNWFLYFGNQKIKDKWNWHNEVQYRNYNFAGDLQQLLLRTGFGYNLTENNNNILLGYAFIYSENYISDTDEKNGSNENRIYQQFITRQNFGRFFIQHRYRIEERFLPDDFKMRFRYFLSLNIPLNKKSMVDKAFYLSAYDEIFLNAESPVFDRNRLYGGLGYVINKNFRIEVGFMAQTTENSNRNQFQFILFNNIPFKNK